MSDQPNEAPERRVFRRTGLTHRIEVETLVASGEQAQTIDGLLVNLGCGGVLARVEEPLEEGTPCRVRFLDPASEVDAEEVEGIVLRAQRGPEGTTLLGIAFDDRLETVRVPSTVDYLWREASWAPTRALVVDDEEQIREMLTQFLSARDCDVDTAADGEEALEKVRENPPDVLFLDIRMPKVNGIEVIKTIREENIAVGPIFAVSAYANDREAVEALELGVADFINKPFNLEYLEWSLQLHLVGSAEIELAEGTS